MSNKISVGEIPQMLEYTTGLNMSVMVTGLSGIGKTEQARALDMPTGVVTSLIHGYHNSIQVIREVYRIVMV